MKVRSFHHFVLSFALGFAASTALAQEISLRAGESADLHAVYWIDNCKSILKGFAGVDVLEGPPGIEITVRREQVMARRQNCPDKVPGGILVLTAKNFEANWSGVIKYRVRYQTEDGDRQSSHSRRVALYAK